MSMDGDVKTYWDSAIDTEDKSCWLVMDFGEPVTLHGFAIIQRGDSTHDVKDHELQTGPSEKGPWTTADSFVAQECKPPAFSELVCRAKNQAVAAAFRQTFDLPSPATARYFRWVAKTRFSEYQLFLYEIEFRFSNWGTEFCALLLAGGAAYVGCGMAYAQRVHGAKFRPSSHPHLPYWLQIHGLCLDGFGFVHGLALGRKRVGRGGRIMGNSSDGGAATGRRRDKQGHAPLLPGGGRVEMEKDKKTKREKKRSSKRGGKTKSSNRAKDQNLRVQADVGDATVDSGEAAVLSEQMVVEERLHQSQAKIKVTAASLASN